MRLLEYLTATATNVEEFLALKDQRRVNGSSKPKRLPFPFPRIFVEIGKIPLQSHGSWGTACSTLAAAEVPMSARFRHDVLCCLGPHFCMQGLLGYCFLLFLSVIFAQFINKHGVLQQFVDPGGIHRDLLTERASNVLTAESTALGKTNRRIRSNVLGHACCLAHGVVEVVPKDTRGTGLLAELTRPTCEHELSVVEIFFGIEHI